MNLTTHSVYPEIQIDAQTFHWVARVTDRNGSIVEYFQGSASSYDDARKQAAESISGVETKYLSEVK